MKPLPESGPPMPTVVLSVAPLEADVRESLRESDGGEVFLELSSLRRRSILASLRRLRSVRSRRVIVTDQRERLRLFRAFLVLTALLIPANERKMRQSAEIEESIRWSLVPSAFLRILWGVVVGQLALLRNLWYLRFQVPNLDKASHRVNHGKCLYLKPNLMFGPPIGGSIGHTSGIANSISRRGTEVKMISVGPQPLLDIAIKHKIVAQSPVLPLPAELNQLVGHKSFFGSVESEIKTLQPDYVYLRYTLNDLTGLRLRNTYAGPLILEFNGPEVWQHRHWGLPLRYELVADRIEKANLRSADVVVVVSDELKKQVLAAGVPAERIVSYPNCIDSRMFDPARFDRGNRLETRRELGVPADADLFTFVGSFGVWHGTQILARAIRQLIDLEQDWLRERRIHFLFVGDGLEREEVQCALSSDLDRAFVRMVGFQPQERIPSILAASDVLVSPHIPNPDGSPFFGSPTKLFEYMATGKLILASDLGQIGQVLRGWAPGLPEVSLCKRAELGILVEPGSVEGLMAGIRQGAATPPQERERIGGNARIHVTGSFTWEHNIAAVLSALEPISEGEAASHLASSAPSDKPEI